MDFLSLLDPRTLAVAASLAGAVFSAVLWAALRDGDPVRGARYWFYGATLISIGLIGNAAQDLIADFVPRIIANVALAAACFILWQGARLFNQRDANVISIVIAAAAITLIGNILFTFVVPSVQGRIALTSLALMLGCLLAAFEIRRATDAHLRVGVIVSSWPLLLFGVFMGIRAVHAMVGSAVSTSLVPSPMNVATHLLANVVLLTVMAGLVILVNSTRAAQVRALAYTDQLTGVLSRRGFYSTLSQLSDRPISSWLVFVFDIDHFKQSNDRKGHATGDSLLKLLTKSIESHAPEAAAIARFGGDEFVMVCPNTVDPSAYAASVRNAFHQGSRAVLNTATMFEGARAGHDTANVSIGFAECAKLDDEMLANALRDADRAMYESKIRQRRSSPPA